MSHGAYAYFTSTWPIQPRPYVFVIICLASPFKFMYPSLEYDFMNKKQWNHNVTWKCSLSNSIAVCALNIFTSACSGLQKLWNLLVIRLKPPYYSSTAQHSARGHITPIITWTKLCLTVINRQIHKRMAVLCLSSWIRSVEICTNRRHGL